jgi:TIR domain
MSPGPDGDNGDLDRSALLKYLRERLVLGWPERISMETVLSDAGLNPSRYIVDAPRAEDRWNQAVRLIDNDNNLIDLVNFVREYLDYVDDAIEKLYFAELARDRTAPITSSSRCIFISYRRDDTRYPAGQLYDELTDHFGGTRVFKDIDSISPGIDFAAAITAAIKSSAILLALIGDRWLAITDETGRRRLDDPGDFVRREIESALRENIHVIPVLLGGTRMPHADELPASLAELAGRQAFELGDRRFRSDAARLMRALDDFLGSG